MKRCNSFLEKNLLKVDLLRNHFYEGKVEFQSGMKKERTLEKHNEKIILGFPRLLFFGSSLFPMDKMIFNSRPHWFL